MNSRKIQGKNSNNIHIQSRLAVQVFKQSLYVAVKAELPQIYNKTGVDFPTIVTSNERRGSTRIESRARAYDVTIRLSTSIR